jgi:GTP cyclohydrolase IB
MGKLRPIMSEIKENTMPTTLPDVQSLEDNRHIQIDRVGIKGLRFPMFVAGKDAAQPTVAKVDMFVSLGSEHRGTHMSRYVALLAENKEPLCASMIQKLLEKMLSLLGSENGYIEIRCPFFVNKKSPVSELVSLMDYEVGFRAERRDGKTRVIQEIQAPVTSLCPCSKEISQYGAHNQRSHITIAAETDGTLSLEEQIRVAETSASCELWSRLKRSDEKFVTEFAYEHPKFVEDTIRDVAGKLDADSRVFAYRVEVENFESIHNHSAYAMLERDKRTS